MGRITIRGDSKECPEGFDYVLGCVGRKPDDEHLIKHNGLRRGDTVLFYWTDVTDIEIDRFKMLCKLHDYQTSVGAFDNDDALCITIKHKDDMDLFFEVYLKGEAPTVEKAVVEAPAPASAPVVQAPAPTPVPVEYEKPKPNYRINFFGWCSEEGHDKVWGYVTVGDPGSGELYNFWGKRGKRLAFQKHEGVWGSDELQKRADQKTRSGRSSGAYRRVPVSDVENVVPGFFNELEKQLTLAKLFDNFRGRVEEDA